MASVSRDSPPSPPTHTMSPSVNVDSDWLFELVPVSLDRGSTEVVDIADNTTEVAVVQSEIQNLPTSEPSSTAPTEPTEESQIAANIDTGNVQRYDQEQEASGADPILLGRGHRVRLPLVKLKDYVSYNASCNENTHLVLHCASSSSSTNDPGMTLCPLATSISDDAFSHVHRAFLTAVVSSVEPKSYREATKHKVWRD